MKIFKKPVLSLADGTYWCTTRYSNNALSFRSGVWLVGQASEDSAVVAKSGSKAEQIVQLQYGAAGQAGRQEGEREGEFGGKKGRDFAEEESGLVHNNLLHYICNLQLPK